MDRKLYKSKKDRKICGVCGGIGEYLKIDPTVVRVLWIIFAFTGVGVFAYFAAAIIMPD